MNRILKKLLIVLLSLSITAFVFVWLILIVSYFISVAGYTPHEDLIFGLALTTIPVSTFAIAYLKLSEKYIPLVVKQGETKNEH